MDTKCLRNHLGLEDKSYRRKLICPGPSRRRYGTFWFSSLRQPAQRIRKAHDSSRSAHKAALTVSNCDPSSLEPNLGWAKETTTAIAHDLGIVSSLQSVTCAFGYTRDCDLEYLGDCRSAITSRITTILFPQTWPSRMTIPRLKKWLWKSTLVSMPRH